MKRVRSTGRPGRQTDRTTLWDGVAIDVMERHDALQVLQRTLDDARTDEASERRTGWIAAHGVEEPLG